MDTKMLERYIELYNMDDNIQTEAQWQEFLELQNANGDIVDVLCAELLRLRETGSEKDAMIYRLADYVRSHWDAMKNDGDGIDEPWDGVLRCLAFCPNPTDPAVLAEAVKAALSFMEAEK